MVWISASYESNGSASCRMAALCTCPADTSTGLS
jgi:hypothetical protein